MAYTIDQFMWGYQQHYLISQKVFVERIIRKIDPYLNPNIFLIGVLIEEKEHSHSICLEPEDCGYRQSDFKEIEKLAKELMKADAESRIHHSHPIAQQNHDLRLVKNSYRDAILKIVERESAYDNLVSFISFPILKDGYLVFSIMQIDKKAFDKHYRLFNDKWQDRYHVSTSLLNSVIKELLEIGSFELHVPEAGASTSFSDYDNDEIMRRAGKNFMYTISSRGDNFDGLHGLFDACNIISSLKYENQDVNGNMIIAPNKHDNIRLTIKFDDPIRITEYRKVRKLLELSSENNHLISDSALIYGIGELRGNYNPVAENLFLIKFTKHYHWEAFHDGKLLLSTAYNVPSVPKQRIDKNKFYSDFHRIFQKSNESNVDTIWSIIEQAITQKHGTMLVISEGAEEESIRLKKQSFKITPVPIDSNFIQKVTNIDGALLLDYEGKCYAMGVILDGLAVDKGSSARGARYNSAIRYYESIKNKYNTFVLIVSEDGMIDFIPSLMPQISRKRIEELISSLVEMKAEKEISIKKFNLTMNAIENYQFYLSEDQCNLINATRKNIESTLRSNEEGYMQIVRNDLIHNIEMNETYFVEKENSI